MHTRRWSFPKLLAWLVIGCGLALVLLSQQYLMTQAQGDNVADYVGARRCSSCHRELARAHAETRHSLALHEAEEDSVTLLADFGQDSEFRLVLFPDEMEPRPVQREDIAFVMGSGRHVQRFVYELDRDEYAVLPIQWNTVEQTWEPFILAENWPDPAYDFTQNCAGCHTTGLNVSLGRWEDDGVQCEACHGPASLHREAAREAGTSPSDRELDEIRATISNTADAQVCGQCHSRGMGDDYPYPYGYEPGMDLVEDFTLSPTNDNAHWWASGHARQTNMQFNEWFNSAHARALTSVQNSEHAEETCLQCHSTDYRANQALLAAFEAGEREGDPPEAITVENASFGITCATCHSPHQANNTDFFLVTEPYALCVECHSNGDYAGIHHPTQEMVEGLPLIEGIDSITTAHSEAEDGPDCLTCHMMQVPVGNEARTSHSFTPVMPDLAEEGQTEVCASCHTDLTNGYSVQFIADTQERTTERLALAHATLETVTAPEPWILDTLAFVEGDSSLGLHNYPYTTALLDRVEVELGIVDGSIGAIFEPMPAIPPEECAECHQEEYRLWQSSYHATASQNDNFLEVFASNNSPGYCRRCHGSGYDPETQTAQFEGVVCSSCHTTVRDGEHPPGPISVADDARVCAVCHSGAHAPTYDEWLASDHATSNVDCVDCHTSHTNGLKKADVNETCGDCHAEAVVDDVHMGEDLICTNCHMTPATNGNEHVTSHTRHTLDIDPGTCAECHGNTHILSVRETRMTDEERSQVEILEEEVATLEETADENLTSGIVGGALGALLMVGLLFIVFRLGRLR